MQRTILLVDDEENITSALARLLRRDGYTILRANSGQAGLALLETNQVGVIISDQRMPEMTGTEFLTKVRALYPDTVRIVLSGYTELNSITDAINRGAVYKFLTKPWEDELLRAHVEEAFVRHEMKLENARLTQALQQANDELRNINQALEERVELKTREIVRNMSVLRVSQEILEHLPVAVIGVADDGLVVFANQLAHRILSQADEGSLLLGEAANTILPEDLLTWMSSGLHQRYSDVKAFLVAEQEVRCWCFSLGRFSNSHGALLVMDAGMQFKPLKTTLYHRRVGDDRNNQ